MSAEQIKTHSRYLAGTIEAELASAVPDFEHDAELLLKFHGIYQQDDRDVRRARTQDRRPLDYSCMVRASAKNYHRVAVLVDPEDYPDLTASLEANGGCTRLAERFRYAQKAFGHTAEYDRHIMEYLNQQGATEVSDCYSIQPESMGDG